VHRLAIRVSKSDHWHLGIRSNSTDCSPHFLSDSVLEMLVIVATLLKHFEFSLPAESEAEETPKICRKPTVIMMPMMEGHVGAWMGLIVKPLN